MRFNCVSAAFAMWWNAFRGVDAAQNDSFFYRSFWGREWEMVSSALQQRAKRHRSNNCWLQLDHLQLKYILRHRNNNGTIIQFKPSRRSSNCIRFAKFILICTSQKAHTVRINYVGRVVRTSGLVPPFSASLVTLPISRILNQNLWILSCLSVLLLLPTDTHQILSFVVKSFAGFGGGVPYRRMHMLLDGTDQVSVNVVDAICCFIVTFQ